MNKKIGIIIGVVVLALVAVGFATHKPDVEPRGLGGLFATSTNIAYNVVGTRVASTTSAIGFSVTATGGYSSTTTYPIYIGYGTDLVSFFVDVAKASSSAGIHMSVLSSNDYECDTATTSTVFDRMLLKEIRWYDAGVHIQNLAGSSSSIASNGATTTLAWTPMTGEADEIVLTDLSSRCLALQVSASSTELQIQMIKKSNLDY